MFVYQEKLSLFEFSGDYLSDYLNQPGQLLIYLGRFLTTFFFNRILGGIIISLIICTFAFLLSKIFRQISGKRTLFIPFTAALGIYFLQTDYHYLIYNSLGLLLQVLLFYLLKKQLKGWLPVLLIPFWYFMMGSFALVFCLMYTCYIITLSFRNGWYKVISLWIVMFITIYLSEEYLFFQTERTLILFPLSKPEVGSHFMIFLLISATLSAIPLIAKSGMILPTPEILPHRLERTAGLLLLLSALIAIPVVRFDKKDDQFFKVENLFYQNRFSEVIDFLVKNPTQNKLTVYLNNIALCETGRLNDMLFHFRQDPDGQTLFLKWEMLDEVLRNGGYFYYTTGMINEALRWAYENMVMKGLTPEGIRMLIRTEIINGNYGVAAKYVSILKKTAFYGKEARRYERFLTNDGAVNKDPYFGPRRKAKLTHDFFTLTGDPYANLEMSLAADSMNRKSFEYKLAYMLLKKDHRGLAENLNNLSLYGFSKIPVHLEEAAIVYKRIYSGEIPVMRDLQISQTTEANFARFMQTLNNYGNDLKVAEPFLRQKFGNTFWYYVFYR